MGIKRQTLRQRSLFKPSQGLMKCPKGQLPPVVSLPNCLLVRLIYLASGVRVVRHPHDLGPQSLRGFEEGALIDSLPALLVTVAAFMPFNAKSCQSVILPNPNIPEIRSRWERLVGRNAQPRSFLIAADVPNERLLPRSTNSPATDCD